MIVHKSQPKYLFLIFSIFLLLPGCEKQVSTEKWVKVTQDKNSIYFIDKDNIQKLTKDTKIAWVKIVPIDEKSRQNIIRENNVDERYSYELFLLEYDKKEQKFRILDLLTYDKDNNLLSWDSEPTPWGSWKPDSIEEKIIMTGVLL